MPLWAALRHCGVGLDTASLKTYIGRKFLYLLDLRHLFHLPAGMCYRKTMSATLTTRRLLHALAILGLIVSPFANPAMAISVPFERATSINHAGMGFEATSSMDQMPCSSMDQLPCCFEEAPAKSGCTKDCPLMAICTAKTMRNFAFGLVVIFNMTSSSALVPANDRNAESFSPGLPARPPIV